MRRSSEMRPRTSGLHPHALIAAAAGWLTLAANVALWRELLALHLLSGARGALFGLAAAALIFGATVALLAPFAWRTTLKPIVVLLLLVAAGAAHFMLTYGVVMDSAMLTNVLQTNPAEAADLVGARLAVTLVALGVLPAVWVWRVPLRAQPWTRRAWQNLALTAGAVLGCIVVVLAAFQPLSSAMRNHRHVRHLVNPLNVVQALGQVAAQPFRRDESVVLPLGEDVRLGPSYAAQAKPPLLVLVLGETARADHFALNGYPRPTTPELAKEGVASFRNAWSCGTSTAASVPCMFSHLGRDAFDGRKANHESLVDVLQRAGLAVLWIDNQAGCKGVCARVPSVMTGGLEHPAWCADGECHDEIMLDGLDARIAALPAERRARGIVVVMHQMGSHGPAYAKRTPAAFKRFGPECTSNVLQDCSSEQLINAYDNTIVYTDHFLAQTIRWLKAREDRVQPALVYLSDHGESLGENNLYLHGLPYAVAPDAQKHVPWITWLSPELGQRRGVDTECLVAKSESHVTHDNLFHSVLGLLDLQTAVYRRELDAYSGCKFG